MSALWVPDKKIRMWKLRRPSHVTVVETGEPAAESPDRPRPDSHFQLKYDKVQAMIGQIGCMDELLSGYYGNCSLTIPCRMVIINYMPSTCLKYTHFCHTIL